ncbi:MAG: hypothetical protein H6733_07825 [Alphaproteobacteria bacterium]|nr:hypothetical protein [Alphaproteobacteria bacterium]
MSRRRQQRVGSVLDWFCARSDAERYLAWLGSHGIDDLGTRAVVDESDDGVVLTLDDGRVLTHSFETEIDDDRGEP